MADEAGGHGMLLGYLIRKFILFGVLIEWALSFIHKCQKIFGIRVRIPSDA